MAGNDSSEAKASPTCAEVARLEERLALLSDTTRLFAEASSDPASLLDAIARRTVEVFGGYCGIALISEDGERLENAAAFDVDQSALRLMQQLSAAAPIRLDGPHPIVKCLHAEVPVVMGTIRDEDIRRRVTDPDNQRAAIALAVQAMLGVPLRARGKSLGLLCMIRHGGDAPPWTASDLRLAQSLADHAALAITRAHAFAHAERELAERRRIEAHLRLVTDLAREFALVTHDYQRLLDVLARRLAEIIGEGCLIRLLDEKGEFFEPLAAFFHINADPKVEAMVRQVLLVDRQPVGSGVAGKVAATGKLIQLPELDPEVLVAMLEDKYKPMVRSLGLRGVAAVPLSSRGHVIGVIVMIHSRVGQPYRPADLQLLQDVASHAALAISNARLFAKSQRELAERERAEQALRSTEEQLRQAQKIEAVGRLAGGVAHDFNNLLSVVLSYCSLLIDGLSPQDPMRGDLQEIMKAGERAADLTRQLLAFSRQQVAQARILDLNAVIANMDKLIKRMLGENVRLQTRLSSDACRVKADPGHLEQVIMNLVVNACDAMPQGGTLTIATDTVELGKPVSRELAGPRSGAHVRLVVRDTGTGMDAATAQRIFEPFFTTKPKGKGTGLGLSTVFGIVQQSGGSITVSSELGRGTRFEVLLPRTDELPEELPAKPTLANLSGSETVLLVEDEDAVRAVARSVLERNGYRVVEARSGADALRACEQQLHTIDLLLTDMMMPQMNGRELSERLLRKRPDLRVLYMSGYTDDAIVLEGLFAARLEFLPKPLTPESLLRKVREVLDAPSGERVGNSPTGPVADETLETR